MTKSSIEKACKALKKKGNHISLGEERITFRDFIETVKVCFVKSRADLETAKALAATGKKILLIPENQRNWKKDSVTDEQHFASLVARAFVGNSPIETLFGGKCTNGFSERISISILEITPNVYALQDGYHRLQRFLEIICGLVKIPETAIMAASDSFLQDICTRLCGTTFPELPQDVQDSIYDEPVTVSYIKSNDISFNALGFTWLNSGRPVSTSDKERALFFTYPVYQAMCDLLTSIDTAKKSEYVSFPSESNFGIKPTSTLHKYFKSVKNADSAKNMLIRIIMRSEDKDERRAGTALNQAFYDKFRHYSKESMERYLGKTLEIVVEAYRILGGAKYMANTNLVGALALTIRKSDKTLKGQEQLASTLKKHKKEICQYLAAVRSIDSKTDVKFIRGIFPDAAAADKAFMGTAHSFGYGSKLVQMFEGIINKVC